ncbi:MULTISPECIES: CPBP family intramembrane glutamic endopeptidase [Gordonia]|uniref:CPBP family intramembrane glutamic endopeptidase n=1 Tax=Gordonia TaxID=2053 RepID=UPI0032B35636
MEASAGPLGDQSVRWRRLVAYWLLACAFSWSWWIPLALTDVAVGPGQGWPSHLPGLLGPAVAAVVVVAVTEGREGLRRLWARVIRWRVSWWWFVLVLATAACALLAYPAAWLSDSAAPTAADFAAYSGVGAWPVVVMLIYVVVVNGLGEETGWRGYLAEGLLGRFGITTTGLIVALPWALWHLPMFWVVRSFRDFGVAGTVGWLVGLTAGSIVLAWIYARSGHSVLIVALWHTAFNLTSATDAAAGLPAALSSTLVMIAAVAIPVAAGVARRRNAKSRSGVASPG